MIAPHVLATVMSQLASAFPGYNITLMLRRADGEQDEPDYIETTESDPTLPAAIMGRWALMIVQAQGGVQ